MISWRYILPMIFSCGAMVAGLMSIIVAARGGEGNFLLAAELIMLSMILDGFDGNIARLIRGTSKFGGEFDTYVDIMSFGIAPALLAYWAVLKDYTIFGPILTSAIVMLGMMRLSRFRAIDDDRGNKGYTGLPITVNAAWIALVMYIFLSGHVPVGLEHLKAGPFAVLAWGLTTILIFLQVSNIRYSKPTKHWIFIVPSALLIAGLFLNLHLGTVCALGMCAYGFVYVFVSPFLPKRPILVTLEDDLNEDAV